MKCLVSISPSPLSSAYFLEYGQGGEVCWTCRWRETPGTAEGAWVCAKFMEHSCHTSSDSYVKDKSASILSKFSSASSNLTHQALSPLPFLATVSLSFSGMWPTATFPRHLILNHRLLYSHLSYYMLKTCLLGRLQDPRRRCLWEHGLRFRRSGFQSEFQHLLLTWYWVTASSFTRWQWLQYLLCWCEIQHYGNTSTTVEHDHYLNCSWELGLPLMFTS